MRGNCISRNLLIAAGLSLVGAGACMAQAGGMQTSPGMAPAPGVQRQPHPTQGVDGADATQLPGANGPAGMSQLQMDKRFVQGALQGGMAEVALGNLALQKSSNEEVKKFAQRMVDDHTKLGEDMKPVAEQLGVKVPDGLSKKDKALEAKLQGLSGAEFDKAYVHAMLKDHQKDLEEFRQEAQSAANPAVKLAAQKGERLFNLIWNRFSRLQNRGVPWGVNPASKRRLCRSENRSVMRMGVCVQAPIRIPG